MNKWGLVSSLRPLISSKYLQHRLSHQQSPCCHSYCCMQLSSASLPRPDPSIPLALPCLPWQTLWFHILWSSIYSPNVASPFLLRRLLALLINLFCSSDFCPSCPLSLRCSLFGLEQKTISRNGSKDCNCLCGWPCLSPKPIHFSDLYPPIYISCPDCTPFQYSMYGHIARLAQAELAGIRSAGGNADIFQ